MRRVSSRSRLGLWAASTLAMLAAAPLAPPLEAIGPPRLVEELAHDASPRSSVPSGLVRIGDRVVFAASDPLHGRELRATGLDATHVELLSDAAPGTAGSDPRLYATLEDAAFFASGTAVDPSLWITDGTVGGTRIVTDESGSAIRPELRPDRSNSATTHDLLVLAGVSQTSRVDAVWAMRSDGRARLLLRGEPTRRTHYFGLAAVGERIFFLAAGTDLPNTLWVTDGTTTGTRSVAEVPDSNSQAATSTHYFFGSRSETGIELWVSDGTAAGTRSLVTIESQWGSYPLAFHAGPSRVYFVETGPSGDARLWVSDGAPGGTRQITTPDLRPTYGAEILGGWVGETFVFAAEAGGQHEIWTHDGTTAPPQPLPTRLNFGTSPRTSFAPLHGLLLFLARSEPAEPFELWQTDGTPAGTVPISRSCPACLFDESTSAVALGDRVLLETVHDTSLFYGSSWLTMSTDGSAEGTHLLHDSVAGGLKVYAERPDQVARVTGGYLLRASDRIVGGEPRVLNGVDGSVRQVVNLEPETGPSVPTHLRTAGSSLYWTTEPGNRGFLSDDWTLRDDSSIEELYPAGICPDERLVALADFGVRRLFRGALIAPPSPTTCLASFEPSSGSWTELLSPRLWSGVLRDPVVVHRGSAYFAANESTTSTLWRSDGTAAGTVRLVMDDLPESFDLLAVIPGHLFVRSVDDGGIHAAAIGGGSAEPIAIPSRFVPDDSGLEHAVAGDRFYFTTRELPSRESLSVSDGTPGGTATLWLTPEGREDRLLDLFSWGDQVLFLVASDRMTLWRSDGTAGGTVAVADLGTLAVDADDATPRWAVSFSGRLFFTAETEESGAELWATDGTLAGTTLFDLVPGTGASAPRFLAVAGDALFFAAEADELGREVWASDGTLAGTRRVTDIAAGRESAAPEELVALGSTLYFAADDGFRGRELWAIDARADGRCVPSERRLCLHDGRFAVEASWRDFLDHSGPATAIPLSRSAGSFWFFGATNPEAVVKVLDGGPVNDHFWLFSGSLSNVGYDLQVTDTETRRARRYTNPPGELLSVSDVEAFPSTGSARPAPVRSFPRAGSARSTGSLTPASPPGPCVPTATRLCLQRGRFAVEVRWRDFFDNDGVATAAPLTPDAGTFWFFDATNPELAVKLLDGREVNGRFWLFCGALSDVEYTLTVTDCQTGAVRAYHNPAGRLASLGDVEAF